MKYLIIILILLRFGVSLQGQTNSEYSFIRSERDLLGNVLALNQTNVSSSGSFNMSFDTMIRYNSIISSPQDIATKTILQYDASGRVIEAILHNGNNLPMVYKFIYHGNSSLYKNVYRYQQRANFLELIGSSHIIINEHGHIVSHRSYDKFQTLNFIDSVIYKLDDAGNIEEYKLAIYDVSNDIWNTYYQLSEIKYKNNLVSSYKVRHTFENHTEYSGEEYYLYENISFYNNIHNLFKVPNSLRPESYVDNFHEIISAEDFKPNMNSPIQGAIYSLYANHEKSELLYSLAAEINDETIDIYQYHPLISSRYIFELNDLGKTEKVFIYDTLVDLSYQSISSYHLAYNSDGRMISQLYVDEITENAVYYYYAKDDQNRLTRFIVDYMNSITGKSTLFEFKYQQRSSHHSVTPDNIVAYPNPANSFVYIDGLSHFPQGTQITWIDMQGRKLLQSRVSEGSAYDVASLPSGHYIIQVSTPTKQYQIKWTKN